MTTNKPKMVVHHINKENPEHRGVTLEPLIRLSDYEVLQAECDALRVKTSLTLGVGDGTGNHFVHGDYESIKRVQALIFECEKLRKDVDILVGALQEFGYGLHQAADGEDDCMCSQCRFIRLRGVALAKVRGEAQPAERQPLCPTCNGRGWNMDWQGRFCRAACPDCAGSGY